MERSLSGGPTEGARPNARYEADDSPGEPTRLAAERSLDRKALEARNGCKPALQADAGGDDRLPGGYGQELRRCSATVPGSDSGRSGLRTVRDPTSPPSSRGRAIA